MVNQSLPASHGFINKKELDLFLSGEFVPVVVAILPQGEHGDFWESYLEIANLARKYPIQFWHSNQTSLAKGLGLTPEGGIVVMRPPRWLLIIVLE